MNSESILPAYLLDLPFFVTVPLWSKNSNSLFLKNLPQSLSTSLTLVVPLFDSRYPPSSQTTQIAYLSRSIWSIAPTLKNKSMARDLRAWREAGYPIDDRDLPFPAPCFPEKHFCWTVLRSVEPTGRIRTAPKKCFHRMR